MISEQERMRRGLMLAVRLLEQAEGYIDHAYNLLRNMDALSSAEEIMLDESVSRISALRYEKNRTADSMRETDDE